MACVHRMALNQREKVGLRCAVFNKEGTDEAGFRKLLVTMVAEGKWETHADVCSDPAPS